MVHEPAGEPEPEPAADYILVNAGGEVEEEEEPPPSYESLTRIYSADTAAAIAMSMGLPPPGMRQGMYPNTGKRYGGICLML